MDIKKLVKEARSGNKQAFVQLIERKQGNLYRTAYTYLHNPEDSMDVLQDTIVKAYSSLQTLKNPECFFTWVTKILINLCCTQIKKNRKVIQFPELRNELGHTDDGFSGIEERVDILNILGYLDEKYRQVIILKYSGDYTLQEISEILKCPLGTVKSRLNYGLNEMRKRLEGGKVDERL